MRGVRHSTAAAGPQLHPLPETAGVEVMRTLFALGLFAAIAAALLSEIANIALAFAALQMGSQSGLMAM
jgi:hypothetical protein